MGSFVNALVWRLHEQSKAKGLKLKVKDLSILHGRSMCVHCHHTLAWYDLLPVISWLSLNGKCRYCHKPISWQYPLVELLTACLFVFSYAFWPSTIYHLPFTIYFSVWLGLLVILVALSVYDLKWMLLPDKLVAITTFLAVAFVAAKSLTDFNLQTSVFNPIWGVLCIAGLFYALFQISGGKWIGGGDVKLGVPLGLIVGGPINALLVIFIASLLGTVVGIPTLVTAKNKAKARIPFGPFLIAAAIIVFLFGNSLITWYKNQFLIV